MSGRTIQRRPVPDVSGLPASLHPVLRRVYGARGVSGARDLDLRLSALLPVSSLDGVEAAVDLLLEHLERRSRIVIVGDYDADGATSTALMVRQLRRLGFPRVDFCVPDRLRHGYGLTAGLVAEMDVAPPALLVTVDNGVAAFAGIRAARARGLDVLVTDHHLPAQELPPCTVMVNPNLPGAAFGSRALAGVGVAFYVLAALGRRLEAERGLRLPSVADLLDLVALGTVADLVALDRNNRILVQEGLRRLRAGRGNPGIRALAEVAGRAVSKVGARDLGFGIAPRLNAAGRIDDMAIGIRCLLTEDAGEALALATRLDRINLERRQLEERMRGEAVELVRRLRLEEGRLPAGLALFDADWHPGIVGLVASRIKERVHRPVVAFAPAGDGELRGSARSVEGVHVRDVLEAIDAREPGLILRYGGHAMAAGLSLERRCLPRFAEAFAEEVARWLSPSQMRGVIESDGELAPAEIALDTARALAEGGPWGQGFPEPVFDGEFEVVESRVVGDRHLKLWARAARDAPPVEAIAFGHFDAPRAPAPRAGDRLRLAYRLEVTEFGGTPRPEMKLDLVEPLPRP